jgi:hypothetical protein
MERPLSDRFQGMAVFGPLLPAMETLPLGFCVNSLLST